MEISSVTVGRLPKYLRILKRLKEENVEFVSSTKIANELNLNPIKVRKDLACVSRNDGKPKVGFEVCELIKDVESFLNLNHSRDLIVVGAGRLGQALMNYSEFENNINAVMAFDIDPLKCDNKKIFLMSKIQEKIKEKNIHIAIITVPKEVAQDVCDTLVKCKIKAIWNFAPTHLKVPDGVKVRNEDLSASLAVLLNGLDLK